jgi:hypothetical protein
MVSQDTPEKGTDHARDMKQLGARKIQLTSQTHLAIPHVAPTRPPYLPRLVGISRSANKLDDDKRNAYSCRETMSEMMI